MKNQQTSDASSKYVYLAGPFFNDTEIANIEYVESVLKQKGFSYFSPMRHTVEAESGTPEWSRQIFELDKGAIDQADLLVVMYYGNVSDSGTAWECGYAYAQGKPIVLVHINREGDSNLMLHASCTTNIHLDELADYDFDAMPAYVYEGKAY